MSLIAHPHFPCRCIRSGILPLLLHGRLLASSIFRLITFNILALPALNSVSFHPHQEQCYYEGHSCKSYRQVLSSSVASHDVGSVFIHVDLDRPSKPQSFPSPRLLLHEQSFRQLLVQVYTHAAPTACGRGVKCTPVAVDQVKHLESKSPETSDTGNLHVSYHPANR